MRAALAERRDLDLALLPGETVNDSGCFIDDMTAAELAAAVPMPLRFSKDFTDALLEPAAA